MIVDVPKEFNFSECLAFLNRSDNECLHYVEKNKVIKLLQVSGKLILIEVAENSKGQLKIKFLNTDPDKEIQMSVKQYIEEWFDLSCDLKPFYKMAQKDGILSTLVNDYYGLRLMGIPDFFEAITWAIIGQHINLGLAYSMKRKLVEAFGDAWRYEGKTYWAFPEVETVAKLSVDDLMMFQFTKKKAEYIIAIANSILSGEIDPLEWKKEGDFEEIKKRLKKIKGVGNWTANYVLMKYFRFPQAFPIEDVGLHNAIKQRFGAKEKPGIEKIEELAEPWKGFEAYATFYLWRSLVG